MTDLFLTNGERDSHRYVQQLLGSSRGALAFEGIRVASVILDDDIAGVAVHVS